MTEPTKKTRSTELVRKSLKARYAREKRFQRYGLASVLIGLTFLLFFFFSILGDGLSAFTQAQVKLDISFDEARIDPEGTRDPDTLELATYRGIVRDAIRKAFPQVTKPAEFRELTKLFSTGAEYRLHDMVMSNPSLIGTEKSVWVPADDAVDLYYKSRTDETPVRGTLSDPQITMIESLVDADRIKKSFNTLLFKSGDSRDPELAGIWGATVGSFYMLMVTVIIAFPIGVMAAIYLEEFAPQNRWTDLIEVNINNLAAVPSIVFGLLGLAIFINAMGLPRSAPLVGGLVLALMTLPVIIIAGRAAIKSVPPSIRTAALGVGASHMQMVFHHVLPLAMPGMLTGAILGMARALGESAPLLMIGMVAFIVEVPGGPLDPSTALPVQVYLWADSPERAFVARTSAAIIVLLMFLLMMNATAVWLRRRFERRW
ncbi:MAG: phosphate ABC transporter permease PstA [Gammaproteobacteria bacterium]